MTERRMSTRNAVCARCSQDTFYTYVKTKDGFRKVCLPCAKEMDAAGELIPEERIILMGGSKS